MRSAVLLSILLVLYLSFFLSCGGPSGVSGSTGEWVKGKALSVEVQIVNEPVGEGPLIKLRNGSTREIPLHPLKVVIWYGHAGRKESRYSAMEAGTSRPASLKANDEVWLSAGLWTPGIISAELGVQNGGQTTRKLALSPVSVAGPDSSDNVEKVRIFVGSDQAADQEIFTITRR